MAVAGPDYVAATSFAIPLRSETDWIESSARNAHSETIAMKRLAWIGLCLLLLLTGASFGGPLEPIRTDDKVTIRPLGQHSYLAPFEANQRAVVIASGNGRTYLGLYVFDRHGNCVAKDDHTGPATCDDCAVEWFPTEIADYSVEIVNLGRNSNVVQLAVR
jgi:hypothetical protein